MKRPLAATIVGIGFLLIPACNHWDRAAAELDGVAAYLEKYGTVTASEPLLLRNDGQFAIKYDRDVKEYIDAARTQAQVAIRRADSRALDVQFAAQAKIDLADLLKSLSALRPPAEASALDALRGQLVGSAASLDTVKAVYEQAGKLAPLATMTPQQAAAYAVIGGILERAAKKKADAESAGSTGDGATGGDPGAGATAKTTTAKETESVEGAGPDTDAAKEESGEVQQTDSLFPKERAAKAVLDSQTFSAPLKVPDSLPSQISERQALLVGVNDKATENILKYLLNPGAGVGANKKVYLAVLQVSCQPGWETTKGYTAEVTVSVGYARPDSTGSEGEANKKSEVDEAIAEYRVAAGRINSLVEVLLGANIALAEQDTVTDCKSPTGTPATSPIVSPTRRLVQEFGAEYVVAAQMLDALKKKKDSTKTSDLASKAQQAAKELENLYCYALETARAKQKIQLSRDAEDAADALRATSQPGETATVVKNLSRPALTRAIQRSWNSEHVDLGGSARIPKKSLPPEVLSRIEPSDTAQRMLEQQRTQLHGGAQVMSAQLAAAATKASAVIAALASSASSSGAGKLNNLARSFDSASGGQPFVISVFPSLEAQTVDLRNSVRDQLALAMQLQASLNLGQSSAAGGVLSDYVKRLEYDAASRNAVPIVTAFSNGTNFGYQIRPVTEALNIQTGTQGQNKGAIQRLYPASFPALILLICDADDVEAYTHVEFMVSSRWIPNDVWKCRSSENDRIENARRLDRARYHVLRGREQWDGRLREKPTGERSGWESDIAGPNLPWFGQQPIYETYKRFADLTAPLPVGGGSGPKPKPTYLSAGLPSMLNQYEEIRRRLAMYESKGIGISRYSRFPEYPGPAEKPPVRPVRVYGAKPDIAWSNADSVFVVYGEGFTRGSESVVKQVVVAGTACEPIVANDSTLLVAVPPGVFGQDDESPTHRAGDALAPRDLEISVISVSNAASTRHVVNRIHKRPEPSEPAHVAVARDPRNVDRITGVQIVGDNVTPLTKDLLDTIKEILTKEKCGDHVDVKVDVDAVEKHGP
jgi:hypothetical protein